MNRNIRHTVLFSMLGALAMGAAWAHGDDMFQTMDSNHDGRISAQEHAAGAQARFARADANHDGVVDAQEMAAGHAWMRGDHDHDGHGMGDGMRAGMMARMDSNHDGVLTAAEHAAAAQTMFDSMDANHDGKVTTAEMQAGHAAMWSHDMAGAGQGMGGHAMAGHDAHDMAGMGMDADDKPGMSRIGEHMRAMDANHDGRITAAEHAAAAQAMFARIDANHDGYLSRAEVDAGHGMVKTP